MNNFRGFRRWVDLSRIAPHLIPRSDRDNCCQAAGALKPPGASEARRSDFSTSDAPSPLRPWKPLVRPAGRLGGHASHLISPQSLSDRVRFSVANARWQRVARSPWTQLSTPNRPGGSAQVAWLPSAHAPCSWIPGCWTWIASVRAAGRFPGMSVRRLFFCCWRGLSRRDWGQLRWQGRVAHARGCASGVCYQCLWIDGDNYTSGCG